MNARPISRFRRETIVIGALICAMLASPMRAQPLDAHASTGSRATKNAIADAMREASRRFHVPVAWLRAVMRAESDGDAKSVSEKGAVGLMQVMPKTYAELRAKSGLGPDPFNPRDNILAGAAYLGEMFGRYGSPGFLAAYNAGPRRYEQYIHGRPLPAETADYVARLARRLGFTDLPAVRISAPSDALGAPLFFAGATPKALSGSNADGDVNDSGTRKKAAPHPLFPPRSDDKIFAGDAHSDDVLSNRQNVISLRTAGLFVARPASETNR
jgi:hypothetical protein